jgi:hypothetical protein
MGCMVHDGRQGTSIKVLLWLVRYTTVVKVLLWPVWYTTVVKVLLSR